MCYLNEHFQHWYPEMVDKKILKKEEWNTTRVTGWVPGIINDEKSAGGQHLQQVKLTPEGWLRRMVQINGEHVCEGPEYKTTPDSGENGFWCATFLANHEGPQPWEE